MKKRIALITFVVCLAAATLWAGQVQDKIKGVISKAAAPAGCGGSCNAESNEVGNRADGGSTMNATAGYVFTNLVTADCAGALEAGYISNDGTNNASARICLYTDDGDSVPDAGDTLIACSDSMATGGTAGVKTADIADCETVSLATNYWLVIMIDNSSAGAWVLEYNATGTGYYDDNEASGWHDSPPANLGTITWTSLNRQYEAWISIK